MTLQMYYTECTKLLDVIEEHISHNPADAGNYELLRALDILVAARAGGYSIVIESEEEHNL